MHTGTQAHIELQHITKQYGSKVVLENLNLVIREGEMVALLGPSGCGKSTTLRILAGLESPNSGRVLIRGKDVSKLPVRERNMGIVFQAYSLFPHMTAAENVAYGLKVRGRKKADRHRRALELLDLVGLAEHADKYPLHLSGGQQQRVALARAIAIAPDVLLLDEPLSALDAKVRVQLREEIRHLQLTEGVATLLVTHDQEEALTMADRVGVMLGGKIEQIANPQDLYNHPQTSFISQFVGATNRIPGRLTGGKISVLGTALSVVNTGSLTPETDTAVALVRPEDIVAEALPSGAASPYTVTNKQLRGNFTAVFVDDATTGAKLRLDMPSHHAFDLQPGSRVSLRVLREDTVIDAAEPAGQAPLGSVTQQAASAATRNIV